MLRYKFSAHTVLALPGEPIAIYFEEDLSMKTGFRSLSLVFLAGTALLTLACGSKVVVTPAPAAPAVASVATPTPQPAVVATIPPTPAPPP